MAFPIVSGLWFPFVFNILLQISDGILTYYALSIGIPEANPIVRSAILQWGAALGLLYWKTIACVLLAGIFALRHRRRALTQRALTITAVAYSVLALVWIYQLAFNIHA